MAAIICQAVKKSIFHSNVTFFWLFTFLFFWEKKLNRLWTKRTTWNEREWQKRKIKQVAHIREKHMKTAMIQWKSFFFAIVVFFRIFGCDAHTTNWTFGNVKQMENKIERTVCARENNIAKHEKAKVLEIERPTCNRAIRNWVQFKRQRTIKNSSRLSNR